MPGFFNLQFFPLGDYTLTATPYSLPNGQGVTGTPLTITFSIFDLEVDDGYNIISINLINADTEAIISNFSDNVIDKAIDPTDNVTIVTEYDHADISPESALFVLEGPVSRTQIENVEPYALFGDTGGVFNGQSLPVGEYMLSMTGYEDDNASGTPGVTNVFNFVIIDTGGTSKEIFLSPNPAEDKVELRSQDNVEAVMSATIFDLNGREVNRMPNYDPTLERNIDVSELAKGVYIIKIQMGNERITKKLVVR